MRARPGVSEVYFGSIAFGSTRGAALGTAVKDGVPEAESGLAGAVACGRFGF